MEYNKLLKDIYTQSARLQYTCPTNLSNNHFGTYDGLDCVGTKLSVSNCIKQEGGGGTYNDTFITVNNFNLHNLPKVKWL